MLFLSQKPIPGTRWHLVAFFFLANLHLYMSSWSFHQPPWASILCRPLAGLTLRDRVEMTSSSRCLVVEHVCVLSLQSCLTLCDPMDCSPPGSSVYGILQARILEWVPMPSSRGSSQPRDGTCSSCSSCFSRWILYHCATWEAHVHPGGIIIFFDLQRKELRLRLKARHLS